MVQEPPRKTSASTDPQKTMRHALVKTFFHDVFWPAYPKRQKKNDALKAMLKLSPDADLQAEILEGLTRAKASSQWQRDNGDYIPLAATWLRAEQWTDEHEVRGMPTQPRRMTALEQSEEAIQQAIKMTSGKTYEH